ncbi:ribosome-recycling factor [Candidatus Magnetominusculus xianensis]|uniref:Ribosome-recycling factor n=2 Tax=Candidatus Magnetominusculus xianensis TaxID=1748249 RepID=A0ABR5SHV4_9BACT|nr:ribosome recycling factor [Candidatus Magnetominusculus xianensis]KWT83988.1 ribosome-recycling factor [Candidatus Magnetominusculus xianensis]MBF0405366.1 ribosome recycling factor [Nitrospirota bacterium]
MDKEFEKRLNAKMNTVIDHLKREYGAVRTGRASLSLLDNIVVDYYGTPTPVNQVAALGCPDPQTISISPWEQKMIPHIEKAIRKSDLDLTPNNDGKAIRITIPPLSEERRKQLVKVVKKKAEESRVAVRNIRREFNEELKKLEKDKHISEDETKKSQEEVQKVTDSFVKLVDEVLAHKEKEIMEV